MVFVIPSTDPSPFMAAMVPDRDLADDLVCYVRGEDMVDFPARDYVASVMPIYYIPRSEGVSSTLLRTVYHNPSSEEAMAAAFARTDEVGRPILASAAPPAAVPSRKHGSEVEGRAEDAACAAEELATATQRLCMSDDCNDVGAEASGSAMPHTAKASKTARKPSL